MNCAIGLNQMCVSFFSYECCPKFFVTGRIALDKKAPRAGPGRQANLLLCQCQFDVNIAARRI